MWLLCPLVIVVALQLAADGASTDGAASTPATADTFNAFFMTMRGKFTQPGSSIHYYVVEWDPAKLAWEDFRGKVLGPTDPASAPPDSLRGMIHADWKALGLGGPCSTGDNAVHASASPFEGLAERVNWLQTPMKADSFGAALLSKGISAETLAAWTVDPQVALPGAGGKKGSLFDALEDMDLSACVDKCLAIAEENKGPFEKLWPAYEKKMKKEGLSTAAIAAFRYNFSVLTSGANLMIPESTIKPVDSLPDYASLSKEDPELLKATVRKADRTRTRAGRMRASHSPREGASPRDRASYCASYTLR